MVVGQLSAATRLHVAIYFLLHGGIFAERLHAGKTRSLRYKPPKLLHRARKRLMVSGLRCAKFPRAK